MSVDSVQTRQVGQRLSEQVFVSVSRKVGKLSEQFPVSALTNRILQAPN